MEFYLKFSKKWENKSGQFVDQKGNIGLSLSTSGAARPSRKDGSWGVWTGKRVPGWKLAQEIKQLPLKVKNKTLAQP